MSFPALRQPKPKPVNLQSVYDDVKNYVILTLKDGGKLVVSSDAYNGVITTGDMYKCVLCCTDIPLDSKCKDNHKELTSHKRILERYPHKEEFGTNLIRKLNKDVVYCTICNADMSTHMLMFHLAGENHLQELQRACTRANSYIPDVNNNK